MFERGLAQLAAMIAQFDHHIARLLMEPLAGRLRELVAQESSAPWLTGPVLRGLAITDARWASDLVSALPDAPPSAAQNPRHVACRLLADELCYTEYARWRIVYKFCGLRDPRLPDEEW